MDSKSLSVNEIAKILDGMVSGDGERLINGIAKIEHAGIDKISFISNSKYLSFLEETDAGCIMLNKEFGNITGKTVIFVDNPYLSLPKLISIFHSTKKTFPPCVSDLSFIGDNVALGENVSISPFSYIGSGSKIGDRTAILNCVSIGDNVTIGSDAVIYPNVTIYDNVCIGDRVIVHSGTTIGSDGFGYVQDNGVSVKIPQVGNVIIENDVEIGANVTIDRATIGSTKIGMGSKIDNLVQIAHNVEIGEGCVVVSQVGISGSTKLGKGVILGGQVGVVGHITIGDFVKVAAKSGVSKSLPNDSVWGGEVAQPIMKWKRSQATIKRLPDIQSEFREMKVRLRELEKRLSEARKQVSRTKEEE